MNDPAIELLKDLFVEAVLDPRIFDINLLALKKGQLADPDGRTNSSGDCYTHSLHRQIV